MAMGKDIPLSKYIECRALMITVFFNWFACIETNLLKSFLIQASLFSSRTSQGGTENDGLVQADLSRRRTPQVLVTVLRQTSNQ